MLGALKRLEEEEIKFRKIAGTSAGAIVASLIAAGYTADEIKKEIFDNGFDKLLFGNNLNKFFSICTAAVNVPFRKGFCNTKYFKKHLEKLFKRKNKTKFKDFCSGDDISTCNLKMIASDITNNKMIILPDDLKNYGINPMEFKIADAVIMSMSFPLYFMPYVLKYTNNGENMKSYIGDGGLCSNFPIWIFDIDIGSEPSCPTFGLNLQEVQKPLKKNSGSFLPVYITNMIMTGFSSYEIRRLSKENKERTINIPIPANVHVTDFNLTKYQIENFYKRGKLQTDIFLKEWNFEEYKKKFRNYKK